MAATSPDRVSYYRGGLRTIARRIFHVVRRAKINGGIKRRILMPASRYDTIKRGKGLADVFVARSEP